MEKWNAFLKDYNCLYANDQQNGLRSKIKLFLRILFSPNTQVLFLIRYRYSSIGKFCRIGYITHIILSVVVVLLEFH